MTSPNKLELKGKLQEHPFAELLTAAAESHFDGSFRLANGDRKAIVYLRAGEIVFAVSNAREHRVFEMLLRDGKLTREQITQFPNFANDLEFTQALVEKALLNQVQVHKIFSQQVEDILRSVLRWQEGEWIFSPLARVKDSINYKIDTREVLLAHARELPPDRIVRRFRSFQETFAVKPNVSAQISLQPLEAFLLSRFEKSFLNIQQIVALGGISEAMTMKTLYALWLAGFLFRQNYHTAFPEHKISAILAAKLSLKPEEPAEKTEPVTAAPAAAETAAPPPPAAAEKSAPETNPDAPAAAETAAPAPASPSDAAAEERRQLLDYLARVEDATTLYQVLGVQPEANVRDIKAAYFTLAKRFHPDLFHKEAGSATHRRIHSAFTEIAHAYEILKDEKSREVYNFKNRDKIAASKTEKPKPKAPASEKENRAALAEESFAEGYNYLMDDEYEEAMPLLARAVHLEPNNARYRAFYGKLLAADGSSRYKAESELQQAVKLDPDKPDYRLMLAQFYIDYNLLRRAEGELQRLLAQFPNNPEALVLLERLWEK